MTDQTTSRQNIYSRVTAQIVADLEKGIRSWLRPWNAEHAAGRITKPLRHNGQPYSGINILMLWTAAVAQGYAAPIWMTYKQARELGAHVRKGEKASPVVYASTISRTEVDDSTGEESERDIPFMKAYSVFNVAQIDGLPAHYYASTELQIDPVARIERAEKFFAALGADIRHGGDRAYYSIALDYIQMPPFEAFRDAESYYATLGHEAVHHSGARHRLNRKFGKRFGDHAYAAEELIAELGAAFLCADLGLELTPREDHSAYLASWLEVLSSDKRAIFTAAAHAQRAVDFLHSLQPAAAEPIPATVQEEEAA